MRTLQITETEGGLRYRLELSDGRTYTTEVPGTDLDLVIGLVAPFWATPDGVPYESPDQ